MPLRISIPLCAMLLPLAGLASLAPVEGAVTDTPRCRAIVAERLGRFEDALRALASAEPSAETTSQRARILTRLGDYDGARGCYESLLGDARPDRELADRIAMGWLLGRRLFQGFRHHDRMAREGKALGQEWMALTMAVAAELRDGIATWYGRVSGRIEKIEDLQALAELMNANGHRNEARETYRRVLEASLMPDRLDPGRIWTAGDALLDLEDGDTVARADARLVERLDLAGDFEYPASRFFPRSDVRRILARLIRHHRGRGSLDALRRTLGSCPGILHRHLTLAVVEAELGERARALAALRAARNEVPDTRVFPVLTVASFMEQLGFPEAAVVTFGDALNALPDALDRAKAEALHPEIADPKTRLGRLSSSIHLNVARIHHGRNAPLDAVEEVVRALLVAPENEGAQELLGTLVADRRLRRRALALLEAGMAKGNVALRGTLAQVLVADGLTERADAAWALYRKELARVPSRRNLRLARVLGHVNDAVTIALARLENPVEADWARTYAWLVRHGGGEKAAADLVRALPRVHPSSRVVAMTTLTELFAEGSTIPAPDWKVLGGTWSADEVEVLRTLHALSCGRKAAFRESLDGLATRVATLPMPAIELIVDAALRHGEDGTCRSFLDGALPFCGEARKLARLHLLRARCIGAGKDRPMALLDLTMALQLLPEDETVHELLLDHLGDRPMRRPFVQGILEKVEGRYEFYPFLARYFELEGKYNLGAAFARVAQRFRRDLPSLHLRYLELLTAAGQEETAMRIAEKDSRNERIDLARTCPFLMELYGLLGQRTRFFAFASRMLPKADLGPLLLPAFSRIVVENAWVADGAALLERLMVEQPEQIRFADALASIYEGTGALSDAVRVLWKGLENAGLPHRLPIEADVLLAMEKRLRARLDGNGALEDRLRLAWLRVGRRADDPAARLDLGRALHEAGDLAGATEQLRHVLAAWDPLEDLPPRRHVLTEHLRIMHERGLLEARARELEELRRDRELETPVLEELELALGLLGRGEEAEAMQGVLEAVLVSEGRWESLATLLMETGRHERAARVLVAAAEDRPRDRLTARRLAMAADGFAAAGLPDESRKTLERLALAFPETDDARRALARLGEADRKAGAWEKAASYLSRTLAGRPEDDPMATLHLAEARLKLGRPEAADAVLELFVRRALRMDVPVPLELLELAATRAAAKEAPTELLGGTARLLRRTEVHGASPEARERMRKMRLSAERLHLRRAGDLHGNLGRVRKGLEFFERALHAEEEERWAAAAEAHLKAALQDPPVTDVYGNRIVVSAMFRRGLCLEALGRLDEAEKTLERAAKYVQRLAWSDPDNARRLAREAFHRIRRSRRDTEPVRLVRGPKEPAGPMEEKKATAEETCRSEAPPAAPETAGQEGANGGSVESGEGDHPDERSLDDVAENALGRDPSLSTFHRLVPETALQGFTLLMRGARAVRAALAGLMGLPPLTAQTDPDGAAGD